MACAVTGPGVTTCRLVKMSPRLASMTKPVACAVVFHSVSKARVLSIWIVTTPVAMRSSVCAQVAGAFGGSGAPTAAGSATLAGRAAFDGTATLADAAIAGAAAAGAGAAPAPATQEINPRHNKAKR